MEAFLTSNTTEPDGSSISDSNNVSDSTAFEEAFPPHLMSDATARGIETVVQVGLLPVLTLCGVTMNVINMAVFQRQGLSDRINLCLFCLALSDTGFISTLMASRLYSSFYLTDPALGEFWKAKSIQIVGLYIGFVNLSSCLTLLISVERCVCVVWPLQAKTFLSVRHTSAVITVAFIVCMAGSSVQCTKFYTLSYRDPLTNLTRYSAERTRFYVNNRRVIDVIINTVFNVTVPGIAVTGVMAATSVISVRMRSVFAWRQQSANVGSGQMTSRMERRDAAVTRMLVAVCVVYVVCTLPTVAHASFRYFLSGFDPKGRFRNTFYAAASLTHLMASINASVNFLVYVSVGTKFKETLKGMFNRKTGGREERSQVKELDTTTQTEVTKFSH